MGTPRGDLGARRAQQAGAQPLPSACPRQQVARSAEGPSIAPTRAPAQLCPSRRGLGQVPALRPHRPRERRCRGGGCVLRAHRASVADGKPEGAVTVWKNQTRNDRLRPRSHEKLKPGAASLDVGDLEGLATSGFGREAGGSQRRGARASLKSCGQRPETLRQERPRARTSATRQVLPRHVRAHAPFPKSGSPRVTPSPGDAVADTKAGRCVTFNLETI